jgi:hypothetical protein
MAETISQKGKDSLDNGEFDDNPYAALILEVMRGAGSMNKNNCLQICQILVDRFGSVEAALEAWRAGEVSIEFVKTH